jgi:hypothetical protein
MNATVIDFAGPWEVFDDVMLSGPDDLLAEVYGTPSRSA